MLTCAFKMLPLFCSDKLKFSRFGIRQILLGINLAFFVSQHMGLNYALGPLSYALTTTLYIPCTCTSAIVYVTLHNICTHARKLHMNSHVPHAAYHVPGTRIHIFHLHVEGSGNPTSEFLL